MRTTTQQCTSNNLHLSFFHHPVLLPQTYAYKTKLQRVRSTKNAHTSECKVLELDPLNRCETTENKFCFFEISILELLAPFVFCVTNSFPPRFPAKACPASILFSFRPLHAEMRRYRRNLRLLHDHHPWSCCCCCRRVFLCIAPLLPSVHHSISALFISTLFRRSRTLLRKHS